MKKFTLALLATWCGLALASPTPPQNPYIAPNGGATMHSDASSSDLIMYRGPFADKTSYSVQSTRKDLSAACPTILFGKTKMAVALCTKIFGRSPVIFLLDPNTGEKLDSLDVKKGSLLGGVYAYMDDKNQLVMVNGDDELIRVAHKRSGGQWRLKVTEKNSLKTLVRDHCGGQAGCDGVVGLVPDWEGNVFVATKGGIVGLLNPANGKTGYIKLGNGERIDNSISSSPDGVAIATSHALYLFKAINGKPEIIWRQPYDRGRARKPGQLSWGTGATPTFFGPNKGSEYLTITDNADRRIKALVYKAQTGEVICTKEIFQPYKSGTENSAIGYGKSLYLANTFGYPYPQYPKDAGPSIPEKAKFAGGMVRIDLDDSADGCSIIWENDVKSAAVPKLSVKDGYIYTIERRGLKDPGKRFYSVAVDSKTGEKVQESYIGLGFIFDSLEMVGNVWPDGTWFQGILSGVVKTK